jgi:uncharacterized protein involved in exopolysaccharide biosynthesis
VTQPSDVVAASSGDEELSLFTLGAILLRNRWRIARWAIVGAVIAALSVAWKPALYRATASFVTGGDNSRSTGLASLAGQFGVSVPSANASQSPEFYARLVKSRVILQPILHRPITVAEMGNRQMTIVDLLEVKGETPKRRDELGVGALQSVLNASVAKTIGGVEVSASTEWPSVSQAIVAAVVEGVNSFNEQTRRTQTSSERTLAEQIMETKLRELKAAEDRMRDFQRTNRQFRGSPDLEAEHDRLERDLMIKQQVYTTVAQSYEDAKIREARDTPVITVLEPPYVPTLPEPRGRINSVLVGLFLGAFFGTALSFAGAMFARRAREGDADALELADTLQGIKANSLGRVRRIVRPSR